MNVGSTITSDLKICLVTIEALKSIWKRTEEYSWAHLYAHFCTEGHHGLDDVIRKVFDRTNANYRNIVGGFARIN